MWWIWIEYILKIDEEMFWIWNKDYGDVFNYVYIYMLYMYNFIEIVNVKWGFLK